MYRRIIPGWIHGYMAQVGILLLNQRKSVYPGFVKNHESAMRKGSRPRAVSITMKAPLWCLAGRKESVTHNLGGLPSGYLVRWPEVSSGARLTRPTTFIP